jgi:hypothetical protein
LKDAINNFVALIKGFGYQDHDIARVHITMDALTNTGFTYDNGLLDALEEKQTVRRYEPDVSATTTFQHISSSKLNAASSVSDQSVLKDIGVLATTTVKSKKEAENTQQERTTNGALKFNGQLAVKRFETVHDVEVALTSLYPLLIRHDRLPKLFAKRGLKRLGNDGWKLVPKDKMEKKYRNP